MLPQLKILNSQYFFRTAFKLLNFKFFENETKYLNVKQSEKESFSQKLLLLVMQQFSRTEINMPLYITSVHFISISETTKIVANNKKKNSSG